MERERFLDRPENVKKVLRLFFLSCAVLILLDLVDLVGKWTGIDWLHYKHESHLHYPVEGWFGFYGFYGLIGCVLLVLAAKVLRVVVMRREDYYDE